MLINVLGHVRLTKRAQNADHCAQVLRNKWQGTLSGSTYAQDSSCQENEEFYPCGTCDSRCFLEINCLRTMCTETITKDHVDVNPDM
ncbi:hypothetical protein KQX54_021454 [Cotesia glomerata]|uniref:Uncharacterized protein n=1 Tax=Cotesia glomerata TaxID=32391 RepID=A0AAV7J9P2_COTGL|nr:hypothetical protein KQX54_021454 [Cotesia glomerata]